MTGNHRGAANDPVIAALKAIRWLITVIAVVGVIPAALIALIVYMIVSGTGLELAGSAG